MASRSLGSLTLDLVVKTGAFVTGMTAAERQANKSLSAIEKRAYKFGQNLGTALKAGAVLATAALGAVAVAVGQAIDRADEMRDLSIRTGIATEKLSEYGYAAKQTGTDIDGLARGLKILSKNAAEAADAGSGKGKLFEALGINVKDAAGNLKQLDVLLPEVADKFKGLEDGTTKAALAQELFGKSGLDLIEFLNQGSDGLEKMGDKAKSLGIIIGTNTANAADEFNDKLADLKEIANGFANQIAAELLPRLIQLIDKLNESAKGGQLLGTSVQDVGGLFDLFAGQVDKANEVGNSTRLLFAGISTQIGIMKGAFADLMDLNFKGYFSGLFDAAKQAYQNLKVGFGIQADFSRVSGYVSGRTSTNARGGSNRKETGGAATDVSAINRYLAGDSTGSGKKGGSGKSEATKEADQLTEAYKRMIAQQQETIALFGQEGEAVKIAYDIKNGELAKWLPARQQEVLSNAKVIDQQNLMKELQDAANQASKEESDRILDGIKATDEVIDQLQFELSLIGKTNAERAKAIELRHLDANATDEQRAAVAGLTEELIRAQENQDFLDDFKTGLADAFVDFVSGAKSAKEAFGDFADELFKRALQFVADKAIDALFNSFSGGGGSGAGGASGGGFWANLIGSFFGGGKASGGSVLPGKFYRVNENGTEMFSQGGRDYLMTGSQGGHVTPAHKMGGGGTMINQFALAAPTSQRTQEQIAARVGFVQDQARRRNG